LTELTTIHFKNESTLEGRGDSEQRRFATGTIKDVDVVFSIDIALDDDRGRGGSTWMPLTLKST
jgi:hypothetical protein